MFSTGLDPHPPRPRQHFFDAYYADMLNALESFLEMHYFLPESIQISAAAA
jgi:hypothetical protein